MALRKTRPSRTSQASPDRTNAAWEREVQRQLGDTDNTLGDVEYLLFLDRNYSSKTNRLQTQIDNLKVNSGLFNKMAAEIEDLKTRLDTLEKTIWLLPLN